MSDKLKTVRDALESCTIAKDRGMSWLHYDQTKVAAALAALSSMEAEAHPKAHGEVELTEAEVDGLKKDKQRQDFLRSGQCAT